MTARHRLTQPQRRAGVSGKDELAARIRCDEPVANGAIYCSARCGCGCTRAAFDQATREAAALAQRMGYGWKPEVWENAGWHYQVVKGRSEIQVDTTGALKGGWAIRGFSAWVNLGAPPGSNTSLQFIHDGATPEQALSYAVGAARTTLQRMENALTDLLYAGPDDASGGLLAAPLANGGT